jgi:hypothetical protein
MCGYGVKSGLKTSSPEKKSPEQKNEKKKLQKKISKTKHLQKTKTG